MRRRLPDLLALLSLPVGLAAYLATGMLIGWIAPGLAPTVVGLFLPLLAAGLVMIPFIAPWLDRRAKADLARIQGDRERQADREQGRQDDR